MIEPGEIEDEEASSGAARSGGLVQDCATSTASRVLHMSRSYMIAESMSLGVESATKSNHRRNTTQRTIVWQCLSRIRVDWWRKGRLALPVYSSQQYSAAS